MKFSAFIARGTSVSLVPAIMLIAASTSFAQTGTGGYAASFLKIPVGARLVSSPDVVAGMHPDATAMYANPAFLPTLSSSEVFVTSGRWLDQVSFTALGAAIPLGRGATVLGIGSSLLYSGGLTGYDDALNAVSEDSYYDLSLDVAVGHRFAGTGLCAALGVTYVREHVFPSDGSGYAFQAGVSYRLGKNLFHAAVRDLAGSVSFDAGTWEIAPETVVGAGRVFVSSLGDFFVGAQVAQSDAYSTLLRLGVDYAVNRVFTLRTAFNESMDNTDGDSPLSAGFGMRYGAFSLEYAYTAHDYFASAHTFSLLYQFGGSTGREGPAILVPAGDFAPPLPDKGERIAPAPSLTRTGGSFLLVGGAYSTRESAQAEVDALELMGIRARIDSEGPRLRIVVGEYASFDEASSARSRLRAMGHEFQILSR